MGHGAEIEDCDNLGPPIRNSLDFKPHMQKRHVPPSKYKPPPKANANVMDRFRSMASMIPKEVEAGGHNHRHYDQMYRHFCTSEMFQPGAEPDLPRNIIDGEDIHRTFFFKDEV